MERQIQNCCDYATAVFYLAHCIGCIWKKIVLAQRFEEVASRIVDLIAPKWNFMSIPDHNPGLLVVQ